MLMIGTLINISKFKIMGRSFFTFFMFVLLIHYGSSAQNLLVDEWTYIEIDSEKTKWGDYAEPQWLRYFGLDMGDVNGDSLMDIVSGRYIYINPGGNMEAEWTRIDIGENLDGILFLDVDGDEYADVIAQALPSLYWVEATNVEGTMWEYREIGKIPATSHTNSQGFEKGQFIEGGKEEFLIASEGEVYLFEIPEDPVNELWNKFIAGINTSDEGIGVGDVDMDGNLDFAAGRSPENEQEPTILVWFENPGSVQENWKGQEVGTSNHPIDRVEIADLNGDGRSDIIISEERWPGQEPDGNLFWYEQPENQEENWTRHRVITQYSMNNLDVADIDLDGDIDILTSEHKGPRLESQLWLNDGEGNFEKLVIDTGMESHLGTQLVDLDLDGDLDIVSTGWDQYQYIHIWRNDAIPSDKIIWTHYSTEDGDLPVPNQGNQQTAALVLDIDKDSINDFVITERTEAPSVVWYKFNDYRWERFIIEDEPLRIEAGGASYDIDGDGDEDIVFGGESRSNEVWWWENPYPNYDSAWVRRTIKSSGGTKHHDQIFGDFNADGKQELVFWNQGDQRLYLAKIPEDPEALDTGLWDLQVVYGYNTDSQMEQLGQEGYPGWKGVHEHEGLAKIDIDGDSIMDIVGGGRWFNFDPVDSVYQENIVDAGYTFTRAAAAQLIEGGRPEILLVVGDGKAPLMMYEYRQGTWFATQLLEMVDNGHTLHVLDFNKDGHMDIFSAEMRFGEGNPDSRALLMLGDGKGNFKKRILVQGYGLHESWITDLDGDGDYDILGKPYTWQAPRLDIWINEGIEE